jgi:hypothetical protein
MQYIERRTRLLIAASVAAALIITLTLGLTLGLAGTPQTTATTPTVPITAITVPPTNPPSGPTATELAAKIKSLDQILSRYPDPAANAPSRIYNSVAMVGGKVIHEGPLGPNQFLIVSFDLGGHLLSECFTLGPTTVTFKAC